MTILNILLKDIEPNPWQTRTAAPDPEYIAALALDIARNGLLQAPVGRHTPDDETSVQLAFGHNRLAAFWQLRDGGVDPGMDGEEDYDAMQVDIRELTDQQMADYAWSENAQRRDVSAIERALAIQQRMESFGWSQADAAKNLGVDRSTVSNLLRLLKLPEDLRANISKGEISERQAMALLPLYEAPEHDHGNAYSYYLSNPEQIIEHAIKGESSDKLRGRVDDYFQHVSKTLEKSGIKLDEIMPEGGDIYCGTCRACDKRMSSRNLCFNLGCFAAKQQYKKHEYLVNASISSGYPVSDEAKGGHVSQPYSDKMEQIRKAGCPNLCLIYSGEAQETPYNIDGFPHARLVCDKRNDSCSCQKGLNVLAVQKIENRPAIISNDGHDDDSVGDEENYVLTQAEAIETPAQPTSAELEETARQARKDKRYAIEQHGKVNELLVAMLIQALKDDDRGAFYVIARGSTWPYMDNEWSIERLYQTIAMEIARVILPVDYDSMTDLVQKTNRSLARLELPAISMEKTLAETFDVEISTETTAFPTL
jgi:ParB/RepB/Spo0J family partition protein